MGSTLCLFFSLLGLDAMSFSSGPLISPYQNSFTTHSPDSRPGPPHPCNLVVDPATGVLEPRVRPLPQPPHLFFFPEISLHISSTICFHFLLRKGTYASRLCPNAVYTRYTLKKASTCRSLFFKESPLPHLHIPLRLERVECDPPASRWFM
jgi:hypothetical protein